MFICFWVARCSLCGEFVMQVPGRGGQQEGRALGNPGERGGTHAIFPAGWWAKSAAQQHPWISLQRGKTAWRVSVRLHEDLVVRLHEDLVVRLHKELAVRLLEELAVRLHEELEVRLLEELVVRLHEELVVRLLEELVVRLRLHEELVSSWILTTHKP